MERQLGPGGYGVPWASLSLPSCFLALPSSSPGADPKGHPAGMFLGTQPAMGKAGIANSIVCAKGRAGYVGEHDGPGRDCG